MSWRLITLILLTVLGASAWGGYLLGNWLIENGPMRAPSVAIYDDMPDQTTLGADGKPYVAQPPQPLVDGRLGVPDTPDVATWEIDHPRSPLQEPPPIALATTTISMAEAIRITSRDEHAGGLQGIARLDRIQPIEASERPPPPSQEVVQADTPPQSANWQAELQKALNACKNVGFFKRPSCAWEARNNYCGPNQAWGKVPNCPKKEF